MAIIEVTDLNFSSLVLRSKKPVLVEFWAPWSDRSRMIIPILNEISNERDDIIIAKINSVEYQQKTMKYGVRTIPTLIIFKDGYPVCTTLGGLPKSKIEEWINKCLSKNHVKPSHS